MLIALQNWGQQHVLGDGSVTATGASDSLEARRMQRLTGQQIPRLKLAAARAPEIDPVEGIDEHAAGLRWTVRATVHGVSTQRPDQLAAFVTALEIPFSMISDQDLQLATALRLPTFRAAGVDRLKRLTLVIERATRTILQALYPVTDPVGAIDDALAVLARPRAAAAVSPPRAGCSD
ncbi:MAG: hypothetical protein ACTHMY_01170 [Solirubrobacteraceae bacterium]